jgi:hypothetical protein
MWGTLPDKKTSVVYNYCWSSSVQSSLGPSPAGLITVFLLSQIRDFLKLEGQDPIFIFPRNRVARLYPQALGSILIASYDSQGYGGGIRTRIHTGL